MKDNGGDNGMTDSMAGSMTNYTKSKIDHESVRHLNRKKPKKLPKIRDSTRVSPRDRTMQFSTEIKQRNRIDGGYETEEIDMRMSQGGDEIDYQPFNST